MSGRKLLDPTTYVEVFRHGDALRKNKLKETEGTRSGGMGSDMLAARYVVLLQG